MNRAEMLMEAVDRELRLSGLIEKLAKETETTPRDVLAEIIAAATQMYRGTQ